MGHGEVFKWRVRSGRSEKRQKVSSTECSRRALLASKEKGHLARAVVAGLWRNRNDRIPRVSSRRCEYIGSITPRVLGYDFQYMRIVQRTRGCFVEQANQMAVWRLVPRPGCIFRSFVRIMTVNSQRNFTFVPEIEGDGLPLPIPLVQT